MVRSPRLCTLLKGRGHDLDTLRNEVEMEKQSVGLHAGSILLKLNAVKSVRQEKQDSMQQKLFQYKKQCHEREANFKEEFMACKTTIQTMKDEQQKTKNSFKTQIVEHDEKLAAAETLMLSAVRENEQLKDSVKDWQRSLKRVKMMQMTLCAAERERDRYQTELQSNRGQRQPLEEQIELLQRGSTSAYAEHEACTNQIRNLKAELQAAKTMCQLKRRNLQQKLADEEAQFQEEAITVRPKDKNADYDERVEELQKKNKTAEAALGTKIAEMEKMAQQNWPTACKCERAMIEAQREGSTLRRKLAGVHDELAKFEGRFIQTTHGCPNRLRPVERDAHALNKLVKQRRKEAEKNTEKEEMLKNTLADFNQEKCQYEDQLLVEQLHREELEEQIRLLEELGRETGDHCDQGGKGLDTEKTSQCNDPTPQQKPADREWARKAAVIPGVQRQQSDQILVPCSLSPANPQVDAAEHWPELQKRKNPEEQPTSHSGPNRNKRKRRWIPFNL